MNISQSKVKCYRQCHRQYYYRYVLKLRRKIKGFHLFVGEIIHSCIENFLITGDYKETLKDYKKKIRKLFDEERDSAEEALAISSSMMEMYAKPYFEEEWNVEEVELDFTVELMPDIHLQVKLDGLVRDIEGNLWMLEHKSCKSVPDEKSRMSDIQTVIYKWALPRGGFEEPTGIIWDYIVKKSPTVPQLLKNGSMSVKKITTTWETYLRALEENDLDPKDYEDMKEALVGAEDSFIRRIKMPVNDTLMENTIEDLKSTAIQIQKLGHLVKDRNASKMHCSYCDYFDLCQSDLRGDDTSFMLKKNYIVSDRDPEKKRVKKA